jgi:hypothetical protein
MATKEINQLSAKTAPVGADTTIINDSEASDAAKKVTLANLVKAFQATAVADANQTITNPPTQAEVQALSDKVDELLGALRTAGIIAT